MGSGLSNDQSTDQPRSDGPTIEEFVRAGYRAADYPPTGYAEKPSPGLDAFRAYQRDPGDAARHAAAATALGVSVGEVTHGRTGGPTAEQFDAEAGARAARERGEVERAGAGVGAANPVNPTNTSGAVVPETDAVRRSRAARRDVLADKQRVAPGSLTEKEVAELAELEAADSTGNDAYATDYARRAARRDLLAAQRQSDPGTLTEAEVRELVELEAGDGRRDTVAERLDGAEDQRRGAGDGSAAGTIDMRHPDDPRRG